MTKFPPPPSSLSLAANFLCPKFAANLTGMKNPSTPATSKSVPDKLPAIGSSSQSDAADAAPSASKPTQITAAMYGPTPRIKIPLVPFWVRNNDPTLKEFEIF